MVWTWFLIGVLIIVLLVVFKFKEIRHKFGLIIISLIFIFLIFSFAQVYKTHKADLSTFDGALEVGKVYFSWLGSLFGNVGKVSSYVVHQEWGLNITNGTIDDSGSNNTAEINDESVIDNSTSDTIGNSTDGNSTVNSTKE